MLHWRPPRPGYCRPQATVTEATAKLARLIQVQQASAGKVPSKTELDTGRATLERAVADEANARAAVNQAQASLEGQRIDLSKSVIRSPINGIVLKRAAEPGQTVAASLQTPVLFTLAEDLTPDGVTGERGRSRCG